MADYFIDVQGFVYLDHPININDIQGRMPLGNVEFKIVNPEMLDFKGTNESTDREFENEIRDIRDALRNRKYVLNGVITWEACDTLRQRGGKHHDAFGKLIIKDNVITVCRGLHLYAKRRRIR